MIEKDIALESDGLKLTGQVYIPGSRSTKTAPALCLCHGIPRGGPLDPSDGGYPALAGRFCNAGFVTIIFNFRGTGDSEGNFDIAGWTTDLGVMLDYLYNMSEVDTGKVALMGFSAGAAVSMYVAAQDPRVSSLVVCACPTQFRLAADPKSATSAIAQFRDTGIIKDADFPPSPADWMDGFNKVKPIEQVEKLSPRPLLIIHGSQDDVVDHLSAWALYERAGEPKQIMIIEGAGHRLRLEEKAMDGALNWLRAQASRD